MTQVVKNLPAMQGTWVQSLGWKDALEKEMATHSSILADLNHTAECIGYMQITLHLYIRDLSICVFLYPVESWNQSPADTEGHLYMTVAVILLRRGSNKHHYNNYHVL